jgi:hypothetical protein
MARRRSMSLIAGTRKLLRNIFGMATSPVKTTRKAVKGTLKLGKGAVKGTVALGTGALQSASRIGSSAVKNTAKLAKGAVGVAMNPVRSVKKAGKLARKTTRRLVKY